MGRREVAVEASIDKSSKKKSRKKRSAPEDDDSHAVFNLAHDKGEHAGGTQIDDNEPTMEDKLATLNLEKKGTSESQERPDPFQTQPPSADSVHVLLKQALHADDRALLLDCLYNQDNKVIANSVALLNAVDIFKLLDSLLSIIQSRGAVLVCAIPWLRSLLLQHSSRIMSQESSLAALNSLYQLIQTRVANLNPALKLASSVDLLYAGVDEGLDEYDSAPPVIYEDRDESEEEESEDDDAMETDEETKELEDFSGLSDADLSEGSSD